MNQKYLEQVRHLNPPQEIRKIITDVVEERISVDDAVETLLFEYMRGKRVLVLDENLLALEAELLELNYTVEVVTSGHSDEQIKPTMAGRVFITENGKDFENDLQKYRYGLVWVVTKINDPKLLAKAIEQKLMTVNFNRNLVQIIKV